MGFVIFFGNGINWLDDKQGTYCSTNNILASISSEVELEKHDAKYFEDLIKEVGFSICCESLIKECNKNSKKDYEKIIANNLNNLKTIDNNNREIIYKKIFEIKPTAVITTNYDTWFEKINVKNQKVEKIFKNKKYKGSAKKVSGIPIYHIHGEVNGASNSTKLCLGFYGYTRFMNSFFANTKKSFTKLLNDNLETIKSSLYEPFKNMIEYDTFIFGFRLDPSEIDIWYFLTLRAYLTNKYEKDINGKIYYYDFINKNESNCKSKENQLREFYKLYNIELITFTDEDPIYSEKPKYPTLKFYKRVLEDIKEKIKERE